MTRFALTALVAIVACSKGKSGPDITPAAFGSKPVPPGRLTKIKPGATQADVKKLYPDARDTPNHSGSPSLTIDSDFGDAEYRIGFYSDKDAVASIDVEVSNDMKITDELKKAWGTPKSELGGIPSWRNEEDGYEADIWEKSRSTRVQFKPFLALSPEFFGKAPGLVADLAKLKWGMTWDQVKATAPGLEGPKGGNGSFIPFQPGPDGVTLDAGFYEDKLERADMRMPARGVAMLVKAWGPGKLGKEQNGTGETHCWTNADKSVVIGASTPAPDAEQAIVTFAQPGKAFCEP